MKKQIGMFKIAITGEGNDEGTNEKTKNKNSVQSKMATKHSPKQLSKLIAYVLGKAPAEFGLVPAEHGFFKIKDLLKALWEEDGFRHVRESHLNEIMLTVPDAPFEIRDRMIRSRNWEELPGIRPAENPPKLLYACVRRKAHAFALEKGIFPVGHDRVVLASEPEMAMRIGRRFDGSPVMMTVQTAQVHGMRRFVSRGGQWPLSRGVHSEPMFHRPAPSKGKNRRKQTAKAQGKRRLRRPDPRQLFRGFFSQKTTEKERIRQEGKRHCLEERKKTKAHNGRQMVGPAMSLRRERK